MYSSDLCDAFDLTVEKINAELDNINSGVNIAARCAAKLNKTMQFILKNDGLQYTPKNMFGLKKINLTDYSNTQLKHIDALQKALLHLVQKNLGDTSLADILEHPSFTLHTQSTSNFITANVVKDINKAYDLASTGWSLNCGFGDGGD